MTSAALSKPDRPMTLAGFFEAAGITEYASWALHVEVTPDGNPRYKPRPYQITGLNHMAAFLPRSALYDDPGTGKTLQMQAFALWMAGLGNKVLAVMLPSLVPQFRDSLYVNFPGVANHIKIGILWGDPDKRNKAINQYNQTGWPDILILSYQMFLGKAKAPRFAAVTKKQEAELEGLVPTDEQLQGLSDEEVKLRRDEAYAEISKRRTALADAAWAKTQEAEKLYTWKPGQPVTAHNLKAAAFQQLGYTALLADEAHTVKNPSSGIHQAVRDFVNPWDGDDSNGLVLATGSPIGTNVEDCYGLISLVDPKRYGSMRTFDATHCEMLQGVKFRKVIEYKNLDYLHQSLYSRGRRITKRDAFPDMPTRVITEVRLDLAKPHKELYQKLVNEQVLELDERLIDATKQQRMYQYVQQILLCPERFADKPVKDNTMLEAIDDIVDSLGGRKVIVFAWFKESIDMLKKHYEQFNPAVINGDVVGNARETAKSKFINDKNCRMLIANTQSGGVGLDGFQHVCSYAVFAEICPHPGIFEQAIGRLERSGQTESVNVFLLVPIGTVAVKLRNDLCRKEEWANQVVQDKKTLIADMLGEEGFQGSIN